MFRFRSNAPVTALGAWLLSAASVCSAANVPTPSVAPVREVSETMHGVVVKDPYRYLEQVRTPEVQAWYQAQGDYTRATLDQIAMRDGLERRITDLTSASGDAIGSISRMPGDKILYLKRPKGERQFKLAMRIGLQGAERILVDPELDAKRTGVPHAINYFRPSWDGKYVAYGLSAGGSENASLHILDVASATDLGQTFPRVQQSQVNWTPDSRSLTFNQLKAPTPGESDTEKYMDSRVMWHTVGNEPQKAQAVFGPTVTPQLGLARLDVASITFTPDSPWMIARTTDTTLPEGLLFVAPFADLGKSNIRWTRISGYEDKITEIELHGNDLYFMTHANAPRKHILKLDLRSPQLQRAVEVVPSPVDGVLQSFSLSRNALVVSIRQGTEIVLRRYTPAKPQGEAIPLPFNGAASVVNDAARAYTDVMYTLSGWTQMPLTYVYNGKDSVDSGLRVNPVLPGLPDMEVLNVEVPSHDGALVPMTLLFKKGLKRDGRNPTLLNAYGSYGFSMTAGFAPARMAWIEQGGVLALANVRGSGVHGDAWYRAGQKATKANTWKDGIACAQYLIAQGFASPQTLAVMGTSAGGIFVGRSVTSAPQLFAAAIFDVGVMDAVRAEDSANGITNISEFGSAANPKEFPALLEMSTYHQIMDGTAYPAIMLVHGMNDPRVDVWHSGKAAARLQAASSSKKPVLLRLDMQAGHGMGSTATQRNAMSADIYAFLLWQMGKASLKE
ncbi:MAG: prolyl oligopeptidase family serine peptidase [Burkholderiales bacterium]|nr:prolyl oligopeptidase family serine peptidase [Burkholderiales bacterium]